MWSYCTGNLCCLYGIELRESLGFEKFMETALFIFCSIHSSLVVLLILLLVCYSSDTILPLIGIEPPHLIVSPGHRRLPKPRNPTRTRGGSQRYPETERCRFPHPRVRRPLYYPEAIRGPRSLRGQGSETQGNCQDYGANGFQDRR